MRYILGDEERKGELLKGVGKFLIFSLDDPFHLTTLSGLAVYGAGKLRERRTNYGVKLMLHDYAKLKDSLHKDLLELISTRL